MFLDARQIPAGTCLKAEICIVGTGPAGLSLAHCFQGSGHRVLLVEAGGHAATETSQALAIAENTGAPFLAAHISRRRAFGGTSRWWAGFCRPLDDEVFAPRPWITQSGWPIARRELDPYYEAASKLAGLDDPVWDNCEWRDALRLLTNPAPQDALRAVNLYRTPNRFFGPRYRDIVKSSRTIDVLLHAPVTTVQLGADGQTAKAVRINSPNGTELTVEADLFVLATGGIENARLLLLSNDVHTKGIGNGHDLVGRYLMNHPHLAAAWFPLHGEARAGQKNRSQRRIPAVQRVALSEARARQEQLAQFSAYLYPVHAAYRHPWARSTGYSSLISLLGLNRVAAVQSDPLPLFASMMKDIPGLARDGLRKVSDRFTDQPFLCAVAEIEQVPNPDSRVTLSTRRDALGLPRAQIDWRLSETDKKTMARGIELLDEAYRARGFLPALKDDWLTSERLDGYPGEDWAHHAGTTRMAVDPRAGVVDTDGKVHGVGNLYIAGCSVFPTEGMAPPTLTIMALALRLGHHLKTRLSRS